MLFNDHCECECHEEGVDMMHIMPCCYECSTCHENIETDSYESHTKRCAAEMQALLDDLK